MTDTITVPAVEEPVAPTPTAPAEPAPPSPTAVEPNVEQTSSEEEPASSPQEWNLAFRDSRAGLEVLGSRAALSGVTAFGGSAIGRDLNLILATTGQAPAGPQLVSSEYLAQLRRRYLPTETHVEASRLLTDHRLLLLRGTPRGGRSCTALRLLVSVARNPDEVYLLPEELTPEGWPELGEQGSKAGLLARAVPAAQLRALPAGWFQRCVDWLRRVDGHLVLTIDETVTELSAEAARYLVEHRPPDPEALLRQLLAGDRTAAEADQLLASSVVRRALRLLVTPAQVVRYAKALASTGDPDAALASAQTELLHRVDELLRGDRAAEHEVDDTGRLRYRLRQGAFLTALAALDRLSLAHVTSAAELLEQRLGATESPDNPLGRDVFTTPWQQVLRLLGDECPAVQDSGTGREVRLRDEELAGLLLDHLWLRYDAFRSPLLDWAKSCVSSPISQLRIRAAQAVGRWAAHDLDHVYQAVILGWASSRSPRQRSAAAWALEVAASVTGRPGPVLRLLEEWCQYTSQYRRLSAVLAYGTTLGEARPGLALRGFRRLAADSGKLVTETVASAMAGLYLTRPGEVSTELAHWVDSGGDQLTRIAVRCLHYLAALPAENGPLLRLRLAPEELPAQAQLWVALLVSPDQRGSWQLLRGQLELAEEVPSLFPPVRELIQALADHAPELAARLRFYLAYWHTHPREPLAVAGQLAFPSKY